MQLLCHSLVAALLARQALGAHILASSACDPGWTICNTGCMPIGSVCCAQHGYCNAGEYCDSPTTCCGVGLTCSGAATCDPGWVECGDGCMPSGQVCCASIGQQGYCDAGESCQTTGVCSSGGGSGGGGGGGGGSGGSGGGSGGGTCPAGETTCETSCMPVNSECCNDGSGGFCKSGYYCDQFGGCCLNGQTCVKGDWSSTGGGVPPATAQPTPTAANPEPSPSTDNASTPSSPSTSAKRSSASNTLTVTETVAASSTGAPTRSASPNSGNSVAPQIRMDSVSGFAAVLAAFLIAVAPVLLL